MLRNCKRTLTRRKSEMRADIYQYSLNMTAIQCPVGEKYSESWLENAAYKAIGQMLTLVEKSRQRTRDQQAEKICYLECADTIRDLQKQSEQPASSPPYESTLDQHHKGGISQAAEVDAKIAENEEAIRQGHERMQELDSEHPCSDERLDKVVGDFQKCEGLTYELAHALISVIYVHGQNNIEIVWKFKDIFEKAEIK